MRPIPTLLLLCGVLTAAPALANLDLAKKHNCMTCHAKDTKVVGPSLADIARKYGADKSAVKTLATRVKAGSPGGVWGTVPMPPNPAVPDADMQTLVKWILAGAK